MKRMIAAVIQVIRPQWLQLPLIPCRNAKNVLAKNGQLENANLVIDADILMMAAV
jgi:hypothetical protein